MSNELTIGIIDDDLKILPLISSSVTTLVQQNGFVPRIKTYISGKDMLSENDDFDLLFCDISFEGEDGIDIAQKYLSLHHCTSVIFVSNREDRVFDSLKIHPFGFVRKERYFQDIIPILESYFKKIKAKTEKPSLLLRYGSKYNRVFIEDIVYIECKRNVQEVHLANQQNLIRTSMTMTEFCQKLEDKGFLHCHKAFLVNYHFIKEIHNLKMELKDGTIIYISKRRLGQTKQEYISLLSQEKNIIFF